MNDDRPEVIPSAIDPDHECVRVDAQGSSGEIAAPPTEPVDSDGPRLCPDGYVPRRRRRDYELDGKRVVTDRPPERNPDSPG